MSRGKQSGPPAASTPAPSLVDALRGIGARRELDELLDRPDVDRRALAGNLRDLRLMNRWLRWSRTVGVEVERLMQEHRLREATLLDLATGSADIPIAIASRAARHGLNISIVATDISAPVLAEARLNIMSLRPPHRTPAIREPHLSRSPLPAARSPSLVQHDATRLPFGDGSVDIATLCLAAHHFSPDALVAVLAEMGRVARIGVIVSDLVRGPVDYVLARLMAQVLRNQLTAHDGPISVLRAYTPAELRVIARRAGLVRTRCRRSFPARMTLVARAGRGATARPHR